MCSARPISRPRWPPAAASATSCIAYISCAIDWGQAFAHAMLALASPTADIVPGEAGDGQVPRQPGQVRKEAAVTSPDLGRSSGLPCLDMVARMSDSAAAYRVLARK